MTDRVDVKQGTLALMILCALDQLGPLHGYGVARLGVVRGVLLKPLTHRNADRLVYLRQSMDGPAGENINFSVPEIEDLRKGSPALGIAEFSPWTVTLQSNGEPMQLHVNLVTGNYFQVMGLSPVIGRVTEPSKENLHAQIYVRGHPRDTPAAPTSTMARARPLQCARERRP